MKLPLRVVCEGCLRSVERDPEGPAVIEAACPYCGRSMESRAIEAGSSREDTHVHGPSGASRTSEAPETIDWAQAWSRGTLGSLGRFQLRERLGDGGFGQVYLAYDPRLDRDVALKVLKHPEPTDRVMERFFREARAVARLDHPNIAAVHDAGCDDGRCWVVYQLVSGRPLWWYRDRQRMDPATSARIIRDLADAVGHAHAMGVVHRDIKPGNVMIDDQGRPRLIDFGLSRRSDVESDLTRDGVVVGTPTYMSPEQAIGQSRQADERSDVYSLGVLFYELLSGRRPQELGSSTASPPAGPPGMPTPLPDIRTVQRDTPARLAAICARAMAPRPSDRYPTARALMEAIEDWLSSRRDRGLRMAAGALALAVLVGMALSAVSMPRLVSRIEPSPAAGTAPILSTAAMATAPAPSSKPGDRGVRSEAQDEPAAPRPGQLVSSPNSMVYHVVPCASVNVMDARNRRVVTPDYIRSEHLQPCKKCRHQRPDMGLPVADAEDPSGD